MSKQKPLFVHPHSGAMDVDQIEQQILCGVTPQHESHLLFFVKCNRKLSHEAVGVWSAALQEARGRPCAVEPHHIQNLPSREHEFVMQRATSVGATRILSQVCAHAKPTRAQLQGLMIRAESKRQAQVFAWLKSHMHEKFGAPALPEHRVSIFA